MNNRKKLLYLFILSLFTVNIFAMDNQVSEEALEELYNFATKLNVMDNTPERQEIRNYVANNMRKDWDTKPFEFHYDNERVATFNTKSRILSLKSAQIEYKLSFDFCIIALIQALRIHGDTRELLCQDGFERATNNLEEKFSRKMELVDSVFAQLNAESCPGSAKAVAWCWLF